jgi:hypothetical protein
MSSAVHKFFCEHCEETLFGETADQLAGALNRHNDLHHPMSFCGWLAITIVRSSFYAAPSEPPPYLVPYTGSAKTLDLTEDDRAFLQRGCIKWD